MLPRRFYEYQSFRQKNMFVRDHLFMSWVLQCHWNYTGCLLTGDDQSVIIFCYTLGQFLLKNLLVRYQGSFICLLAWTVALQPSPWSLIWTCAMCNALSAISNTLLEYTSWAHAGTVRCRVWVCIAWHLSTFYLVGIPISNPLSTAVIDNIRLLSSVLTLFLQCSSPPAKCRMRWCALGFFVCRTRRTVRVNRS